MAIPTTWGDPTIIPDLVAEDFTLSHTGLTVSQTALTNAISEITLETQTTGSALLSVQLIDPDWKIIRSGLVDRDAEGFLPRIDVNFPRGTPVWWRLAMEEHQSVDQTDGPNLTLTFQQRFISYLMSCWGPLGWPGGKAGQTRAQFLKMLVDRMASELPKGVAGRGPVTPTFVCPAINEIQPVASSGTFGNQVITAQQATAQAAGINKLPALTAASKVTAKGQKLSSVQIQTVNTLLGVGQSLNAPTVALVAIIYAGLGETSLGADASTYQPNFAGYWGILQGSVHSWPDPHDTTGMANAFFNGDSGRGFQAGGAIHLAKSGVTNPAEIAIRVEVPSIWPSDAYATEWSGGEAQGVAEATAIVNAFGAGTIPGMSALDVVSDIAQLTRGTSSNPDEDSWSCMQRLGGEVGWSIFSSPSPHPDVWGNYLYFMDGPTLVAQKPSLYLELSDDGSTWSATDPESGRQLAGDGVISSLSGTNDNTSVIYQVTRKVRGKVMHKTSLRTPQTPTQVRFNMNSGVMEFCAGDVFVFHNAGPDNGRWIVEDVTHNTLNDQFAQLTLGPPVYPYPEPQANSVSALGANVATPSTPTTAAGGASVGGTDALKGVGNTVAGHPELKPGIARMVNAILKQWPKLLITSTTGGGHATNSYHYLGEACDLASSDYGYMNQAAAWIAQNFTADLTEGIHNPGSSSTGTLSVKDGQSVSPAFWGATTWGGHLNHIHVAVAGAQASIVLSGAASLPVPKTVAGAVNQAGQQAVEFAQHAARAGANEVAHLGGVFSSIFKF